MSPLGQQVARMLAPERWGEWVMDCYTLDHPSTGLRLWMANIPWWDFEVYSPRHHVFTFWERCRLYRMARRVKRHLLAEQARRHAEELRKALETDEERAIEELLRG